MIRDIQINPFTNEILKPALKDYEVIVKVPDVPNYPGINPTMYIIFLDEVPYLLDRVNHPVRITNNATNQELIETGNVPGLNEYRIAPYGSGRPNAVQFSNLNAGAFVKIKYSGWGSVVTYQNFVSRNGDTMSGNYTNTGNVTVNGFINSFNITASREIIGLGISNSTSAPNTHLIFEPGFCFDSTYSNNPTTARVLKSNTTTIKRLDQNWAAGNNGGMRQGALSANSTYFIYIIGANDGTVDFLAVRSTDTVSLPTGYSLYRRVGVIMTNATNQIIQFTHYPEIKTYYYKQKIITSSVTIPTTEAALYVNVPRGLRLIPLFNFTSGRPNWNATLAVSIRGVEREFQTFNNASEPESNFNAETGFYNTNTVGREELGGVSFKYSNFITNTNGELFFTRSGAYYTGTAFLSVIQTYGFVDFSI